MKYIACKSFNGNGLCGQIKVSKGTHLEVTDSGIITANEKPICLITSQRAYDYFAYDDDGNGKVRYNLTHTIISNIGKINHEAQTNADSIRKSAPEEPTEEQLAELNASIEACYAKPRALLAHIKSNYPTFVRPNGSWSFDFYRGGIAELQALDAKVKEEL